MDNLWLMYGESMVNLWFTGWWLKNDMVYDDAITITIWNENAI